MVGMDPAVHRGEIPLADRYRRFARHEARGVSPVYETWAEEVADDSRILALLATVPPGKQQPNLVFAAARHHGADGSYASFRSTITDHWHEVRATIMSRATQTNEAGRCAVLLPFLAELPQPLALLEVGASAGLCLLPDRYSYRYSHHCSHAAGDRSDDDHATLDPDTGPSAVTLACDLGPGLTAPRTLPEVVWRAGIDLAPVDVADDQACAWLETLIWPGHDARRERLHAALGIARRDPPRVVRGDLLQLLPDLAREAPQDATLVVFHSAVLAYLAAEARARFIELVGTLPGHWISNEGQRVLGTSPVPAGAGTGAARGGTWIGHGRDGAGADEGRFLLSVDGQPRALADPHGRSMLALDPA